MSERKNGESCAKRGYLLLVNRSLILTRLNSSRIADRDSVDLADSPMAAIMARERVTLLRVERTKRAARSEKSRVIPN